tara:strand:- start:47364 stop:47609 length:246 start_codon:yes stop_codon:yes gene_type:complete
MSFFIALDSSRSLIVEDVAAEAPHRGRAPRDDRRPAAGRARGTRAASIAETREAVTARAVEASIAVWNGTRARARLARGAM